MRVNLWGTGQLPVTSWHFDIIHGSVEVSYSRYYHELTYAKNHSLLSLCYCHRYYHYYRYNHHHHNHYHYGYHTIIIIIILLLWLSSPLWLLLWVVLSLILPISLWALLSSLYVRMHHDHYYYYSYGLECFMNIVIFGCHHIINLTCGIKYNMCSNTYTFDTEWAKRIDVKPCVLNISKSLRWRHNGRDCVSNHQPHNCLLNHWFGRRSK